MNKILKRMIDENFSRDRAIKTCEDLANKSMFSHPSNHCVFDSIINYYKIENNFVNHPESLSELDKKMGQVNFKYEGK